MQRHPQRFYISFLKKNRHNEVSYDHLRKSIKVKLLLLACSGSHENILTYSVKATWHTTHLTAVESSHLHDLSSALLPNQNINSLCCLLGLPTPSYRWVINFKKEQRGVIMLLGEWQKKKSLKDTEANVLEPGQMLLLCMPTSLLFCHWSFIYWTYGLP